MSTKAVIIWLFLAVVLGAIAIWVLLTPQCSKSDKSSTSQIAVGDPIIQFVPGEVRQITVETPGDGLRQIVEHAPLGKSILGADADWQLRIEPLKADAAAPPVGSPWPLESARIQMLLRALAETRAIAPAPTDASLGEKPAKVILQLAASTITLTLADRSLAGTGLLVIDTPTGSRRAVVRDDLHHVFTDPGPRAWRDRLPFGGIAPDASRIRVESSAGTLLLGKLEGKWNLIEPVPAPADPAAVQQLVAQLSRVQIVDFLDTGSPGAATGLEKPIATLRIEADRRLIEPSKPEPTVTTDALELTIGGSAAGASASSTPRVYASANGERLLLLDGRSVALTGDPAAYAWPSPIREVTSNIGGFSLTPAEGARPDIAERTYRRAGTNWAQILPGNRVATLSDSERRGVEDMLTFLSGDRAQSGPGSRTASPTAAPTITFAAPEGTHQVGTLRVEGLGGSALDTLDVLAIGADKVVVRTGRVWRTYGASSVPALLASAAQATAPTTPAPPTPAAPKQNP
jgi:hypothetical protein